MSGLGTPSFPNPNGRSTLGCSTFRRLRLRAYRPETAIAEKLHAIAVLGEVNRRDFFHVYALAEHNRFDGEALTRAMRATFERRRTPIPGSLPLALTRDFAAIPAKQIQWQGFLPKNGLASTPTQLGEVVARIATFLGPVIAAARDNVVIKLTWPPGGPWRDAP